MAEMTNLSMNLFGIPYQFPEAVDPRYKILSESIGKKFCENIMLLLFRFADLW